MWYLYIWNRYCEQCQELKAKAKCHIARRTWWLDWAMQHVRKKRKMNWWFKKLCELSISSHIHFWNNLLINVYSYKLINTCYPLLFLFIHSGFPFDWLVVLSLKILRLLLSLFFFCHGRTVVISLFWSHIPLKSYR